MIEAQVKSTDSTRPRQLPPLCLSSKRVVEENIERRLMDDRSDHGGIAANSGLSATDRRVIEAHTKSRDSYLLCAPLPSGPQRIILRETTDGRQE